MYTLLTGSLLPPHQQRVLYPGLLKGLGAQHAARALAARLRLPLCTRVGEVPGRPHLQRGQQAGEQKAEACKGK